MFAFVLQVFDAAVFFVCFHSLLTICCQLPLPLSFALSALLQRVLFMMINGMMFCLSQSAYMRSLLFLRIEMRTCRRFLMLRRSSNRKASVSQDTPTTIWANAGTNYSCCFHFIGLKKLPFRYYSSVRTGVLYGSVQPMLTSPMIILMEKCATHPPINSVTPHEGKPSRDESIDYSCLGNANYRLVADCRP